MENGARLDVSRLPPKIRLTRYGLSRCWGWPGQERRNWNEKNGRKHTGNEPRRRLYTGEKLRQLFLPLSTIYFFFLFSFFPPFRLPHSTSSILLSPFSLPDGRSSATQHIWTRPSKLGNAQQISTTKEAEENGKWWASHVLRTTTTTTVMAAIKSAIHPAECKTHTISGDDNIGGQSRDDG